jgi:hypothetical protein
LSERIHSAAMNNSLLMPIQLTLIIELVHLFYKEYLIHWLENQQKHSKMRILGCVYPLWVVILRSIKMYQKSISLFKLFGFESIVDLS